MNDPIISPWVFYILNALEVLTCIIVLSANISAGLLAYATWKLFRLADCCGACTKYGTKNCDDGVAYYDRSPCRGFSLNSNLQELDTGFWRKAFTVARRTTIVLIIMMVLVPNQRTAQQMIVAHYITPNNISIATQAGKDIFDYVLEKSGKELFGERDKK